MLYIHINLPLSDMDLYMHTQCLQTVEGAGGQNMDIKYCHTNRGKHMYVYILTCSGGKYERKTPVS